MDSSGTMIPVLAQTFLKALSLTEVYRQGHAIECKNVS